MTAKIWNLLYKSKNKKDYRKGFLDILLKNRGVVTKKDKEEFLNPSIEQVSIEKVGIDSNQIGKTLSRIKKTLDKGGEIVIYGDYDVDGITGTAILWETLYALYKNVYPYIPHRADEGYGLSIKGIDNLISERKNIDLIITVDNGIVANEAVEYANSKNIDVIITDHHARSKDPGAFAIVHTTRICGSAIAYLLSKSIREKFVKEKPQEDNHLELAALATVADLVPLVGASRAIVRYGLDKLKKTNRVGLLEIFREAGIKSSDIDTYHIGHIIAPRLNASGRITHALDSLRLLCTNNLTRARNLAESLGRTNKERQLLTQEAAQHASSISVNLSAKFIFVHDKSYNEGIIGLVASRLVEAYYRPSIVVSVGDTHSKGSARSVKGFNIIEYIRTFDKFLVNAGGHPMAAGFTIKTENLEQFRKELVDKARDSVSDTLLKKTINIDMELKFSDIDEELYKTINQLSPFGMANEKPIFLSKSVVVDNLQFLGKDRKHIKMYLSQDKKKIEALYFGVGELPIHIGDKINVVYSIDKNEWNGVSNLQLNIKDLN